MTGLFWFAFGFIVYTYLGYPLLIFICSRLSGKPVQKALIQKKVSLVISVYNEEFVMRDKLNNCQEIDYPRDQIEFVVSSDGSSDQTHAIVEEYALRDSRIKLLAYEQNEGKMCSLNKTLSSLNSDIIVFTDAAEMMDPMAVRRLVDNFADPAVGCVSGELEFVQHDNFSSLAKGVDMYWRYEKFLRKSESRFDSMLGATGALYAIRRDLYKAPPAHTILDDVHIPFGVILKGFRAVFEQNAKIYERISQKASEEFFRKIRTLAGNYQLIADVKHILNPFKNRVFWQFLSHKIFRLFIPYSLLLVFIGSFSLPGDFYKMFFILQLAFYGLAMTGAVLARLNIRLKPVAIPYSFCILNLAAICGLFYFLKSGRSGRWIRSKK